MRTIGCFAKTAQQLMFYFVRPESRKEADFSPVYKNGKKYSDIVFAVILSPDELETMEVVGAVYADQDVYLQEEYEYLRSFMLELCL